MQKSFKKEKKMVLRGSNWEGRVQTDNLTKSNGSNFRCPSMVYVYTCVAGWLRWLLMFVVLVVVVGGCVFGLFGVMLGVRLSTGRVGVVVVVVMFWQIDQQLRCNGSRRVL